MDIHAELIRADATRPVFITIPDATFSKVRETINARLGQYVPVEGIEHTMVVDEEGLLEGKPLNMIASVKAGQPIVGDALIVKFDDVDTIPYE